MRCINAGDNFPIFQTDTTKLNCKYCYLMYGKFQRQVKTYCERCDVLLCLTKDSNCFKECHTEQLM